MRVYIITGKIEHDCDNSILGVYEDQLDARIAQRDFDQKYFITDIDGYEVE